MRSPTASLRASLSVALTILATSGVCQSTGDRSDGLTETKGSGDVTVVTNLSSSWPCAGRSLGAELEYARGGSTGIPTVKLGYNAVGSDDVAQEAELRVDIDGASVELGPLAERDFASPRMCRNLAYAIGVRVSPATFLRIVNARWPVFFAGSKRLDVREEDLHGLRKLARRLE